MNLTPIVFFAYNRPQHTLNSLESLSNNIGADKSNLYIFCDGLKDKTNEENEEKVFEVRKVVRLKKWCREVEIIERRQNWGLAKSIIHGVSSICREYGRVIVVEDDLILSPYFLSYMNLALSKYSDESQVMHVSGYMYPAHSYSFPETFFLRQIYCWGWATWDRAWSKFNPNGIYLLDEINRRSLEKEFSMDGAFDFHAMLQDYVNGKIDSWAIRWQASVFLNQGLSLTPHQSLTKNIGFDGSGTHSGKGSSIFDTEILNTPVENLTSCFEVDASSEAALKNYFFNLWEKVNAPPPKLPVTKRIINRLSNLPKSLKL